MDRYIGKPINDVLDELKRLGLKSRVLSSTVPNIITADYDQTRYNLYVEEDGTVSKITFG